MMVFNVILQNKHWTTTACLFTMSDCGVNGHVKIKKYQLNV